jgi:NADH-quinone oxidoreductase subunit F
MVLGDRRDMTAVAAGAARFLAVESCGQCTPCKADGLIIAVALENLCRGEGGSEDLDALAKALTTVGDSARCNLARQQQAVVGAIVDGWLDELVRQAASTEPIEPLLVAELTSLAGGKVAVDEERRRKQPDWSYDEDWSGTYPADSR